MADELIRARARTEPEKAFFIQGLQTQETCPVDFIEAVKPGILPALCSRTNK
jgi:hypothetical protein